MAKLSARFELEDRISKKLRKVSDSVKDLERNRSKLDKPLVMRVEDRATRPLNRIYNYVRRDIAKTHRLMISLRDQATRPLNRISNFVRRRMPRTHNLIINAQDRARTVLERIRRYANRHLSKPYMLMVSARDRATSVLHKIANYARRTLSKGYNFSVRAFDIASKTVGRIASYARTAIPRYRDFTIRAWDRATGIVRGVRRALFSIPAMITVTLAVVGLGSLNRATIGSAMNFEGYGVAMEHWLDGNTKQAEELVQWMGQFADTTPFSSVELFPALSRGVGVVDGDVEQAQSLLEIASNMAALTPNRTVEDAMEALASAQMGEFELLKGYNMKITAEDYEDMGWTGFLDLMGDTFEDGAKKFSQTASGQLATLRGYSSSIMREAGVGILESMKPRLDAITAWLDNNQETWGRWKDTVQESGAQAAEWVFTKLEGAFSYLRDNYLENDEFRNLDFEGKVSFIMDDLRGWWNESGRPLMVDVSKDVGNAIFEGVKWGLKEGFKTIGSMWSEAFKDPSAGSFASAGIATAIGASVISLLVSPLIRAFQFGGKVLKGAWGAGKWIGGLFGKGKGGKGVPPVVSSGRNAPATNRQGRTGFFGRGRRAQPDYRNPWFDKGTKPFINVPNAGKGAGGMLSKLGNFGKRIPVLGTLLGGLALATSPNEDKAGVAGSIGGGIAGASAGAALGSFIPGIGTAIGGIIGGVLGSFGGSAVGDWFSDNWSSIKEGASDASAWVSDAWDDTWLAVKEFGSSASEWVSNAWTGVSDWFDESVWSPIKEGAEGVGTWISDKFNAGLEFVEAKWSAFSGWFDENVWTPISNSAINTMNFFVGLWDMAREVVSEAWSSFSNWFDEAVWEPVKQGASIAGQWISDRWTDAKEWTSATWSSVSGWFDESVWQPIKLGVLGVAQWTSDRFTDAKTWVSETWQTVSAWFEESVWTPIKTGVSATGTWISEKYEAAKTFITESWGLVSGWFSETVWEPIKTGASAAGEWISEKYEGAKNAVSETWESVSGWFDEVVWNPIESAASAVGNAISGAFESAWATVEPIWSSITGAWDTVKGWGSTIKGWGGNVVDFVSNTISRGEDITGITPDNNATGGHITQKTLSWIGEAGNEYVIPTQTHRNRGRMLLNQAAGDLGMRVVSSDEAATLPADQVTNIISSSNHKPASGSGRDVIININGDNYYSDEMDAQKVADIAVDAVKKELEDDYNESGELVVYG